MNAYTYRKAGNATMKFKKEEFSYFNKKSDKIDGYICLSDKKESNDTIGLLKGMTKKDLYITKEARGKIKGYITTVDGYNIGIYKRTTKNLIVIIAIAVGIIGLMSTIALAAVTGILGDKNPVKDMLPIEDGKKFTDMGGDGLKEVKKILKDDPGIDFPIYSLKEFVIDDKNPSINFGNPETNIVLFQYIVTDSNGKVVHKTNLIQPGKAVAWNPKGEVKDGKHSYNLEVKTYTPKEQVETNGFKTSLTIYIK